MKAHSKYLLLTLLILTSLCTSVSADEGLVDNGDFAQAHNPDPWEGFNRKMYRFNEGLDKALLRPTAESYRKIIPVPVRKGVRNFFGNLSDVGTAINNLLQGKPVYFLSDTGRVLINTTLGIGGLFDIASKMNLEKHHEDFGQTLAVWGVKDGPYLVLPILGSSSLKDITGFAVDMGLHPASYVKEDEIRYTLLAVLMVDKREGLLDASDILEQAALDPYAFQRDAYLQARRYAADDGINQDYDF